MTYESLNYEHICILNNIKRNTDMYGFNFRKGKYFPKNASLMTKFCISGIITPT